MWEFGGSWSPGDLLGGGSSPLSRQSEALGQSQWLSGLVLSSQGQKIRPRESREARLQHIWAGGRCKIPTQERVWIAQLRGCWEAEGQGAQ